jgi:signal transduction histidine kinase
MSLLQNLPIKWKLIIINTLTSFFVMLVAGVIFFAYERSSYLKTLQQDIETLSDIAAANSMAAITFQDVAAAEDTLRSLREQESIVAAALYSKDGKLFARYVRYNAEWTFPVAPTADGTRLTDTHLISVRSIRLENERVGTIYLVGDLKKFAERLRIFLLVILLITLLTVLLAFIISAQLQKVISKPIGTLASTATAVSEKKDYSIRAEKSGADELGYLIDRFNDMLSQIQQRDLALHQAQLELERRVEDRTAEIKRLNTHLEQRASQLENANKELESFSYSVSHDLRAPLRHISGFVDLLAHDAKGQLNEQTLGHVQTIQESVKEAGALIDDLLSFSRMGRSEMQYLNVDLAEMVETIREKLKADVAGRKIEWKVGALPTVQADPAMMRLVLTNLLSNAVKYTRKREVAQIEIGSTSTDAEFQIYVKDNGIGFDMRYVDRLFGVFHRLHGQQFEGTGIGLATVRRIIARHGGRTWAVGEVDKGAAFYFALPRNNKEKSW